MKKIVKKYTQLVGGKADWLHVALALTLGASLTLLAACNPFQAVQNAVYPACQTNNTASVVFHNGSTTTSRSFYVDGGLKATLSPGASSSSANYSAGSHYVQVYTAGTFTTACTASTYNWAQCGSYTVTCN